jgi:hypothetical protein
LISSEYHDTLKDEHEEKAMNRRRLTNGDGWLDLDSVQQRWLLQAPPGLEGQYVELLKTRHGVFVNYAYVRTGAHPSDRRDEKLVRLAPARAEQLLAAHLGRLPCK